MRPHDEQNLHEESLETMASREVFGALGTVATAQLLTADPTVRARVRSTVVRGFLPLAIGVLAGGLIGARFGGALGWLVGSAVGLYLGARFSASR